MSENENQDNGEIEIDEKTTLLPPETSENLPAVTNENFPKKRERIHLTEEEKKLIEEAVHKVNNIKYNTILNAYSEIGKYILDTFFEGKPELAASRDPNKLDSFGKLCKRNDLPFSASTLSRMLRVACFEKELENEHIDHKNIPFTHKAILIRVEDKDERINKFKEISKEQISSRKLEVKLKKEFKKPRSTRKSKSKAYDENDILQVIDRIKEYLDNLNGINLAAIDNWLSNIDIKDDIDIKLHDLHSHYETIIAKLSSRFQKIKKAKTVTEKLRKSAQYNQD